MFRAPTLFACLQRPLRGGKGMCNPGPSRDRRGLPFMPKLRCLWPDLQPAYLFDLITCLSRSVDNDRV